MNNVLISTLVLYIVLSPIYIFPSGYPQVADVVMAVCVAFFSVYLITDSQGRHQIEKKDLKVLSAGLLFVMYTWIVNWAWVTIEGNPGLYLNSMYYSYNLMCMLVIIGLYRSGPNVLLSAITYAIAVSLCLLFVLSLALYDAGSVRQVVTFNNPNQLGYFAVLCASLFMIASERINVHIVIKLVVLFISLWISALSLSSAAMMGITGLLAVVLFRRPKAALIGATCVTAMVMLIGMPDVMYNQMDRVQHRVMNMGESSDDSLEGRGYDRLREFPEYLLFGAGEGAAINRSFGYELVAGRGMYGGEFHSTFGSILFGYGVLGFLLFAWFVVKVYFMAGIWMLLWSIPVVCYGLTHHGLRSTMLWMMVALIWCIVSEESICAEPKEML